MLQIHHDTAKRAVNLLWKMKESRWINRALNSIKLKRNASRAQYKCEIQGWRWTSNETLLPHLPISGEVWIQPPPSRLFVCPLIQSCVICRMAGAPQEQTCYLKTSGWLFEAKAERRANKDPNTEQYSSFQSGVPTLETTQKLNGLQTPRLGKIQL